jgi:flagellar hook-associated protein 1 FlgK
MADTFGIGLSALNSLQAAIKTTGQNIANVNTDGYSKQTVDFATNPPDRLGANFIGSGVSVASIERSYDEFLTRDVWNRTSSSAQFTNLAESATRVDELFADPSTGIGPALSEFFSALEAVSNSPTTLPERELALSTGETLAQRFAYFDDRLSSFQDDLNIKIDAAVKDVNQFAEAIASLNDQISLQQAQGGGIASGDLLDKRDQAITELSELVKTTIQEQSDGALNVFIGQGQPLVIGSSPSTLTTTPDQVRANRLNILLTSSSGFEADVTNFLSEGSIGASLEAYEDVIEQARRDIGALAAGITVTFNEVHSSGFDLNDVTGLDFFDPSAAVPVLSALEGNTGVTSAAVISGGINAVIYDPDPALSGDISQLTGDSYRVSFAGGNLSFLNLTTQETTVFTGVGGSAFDEVIDGVRVTLDAPTAASLATGDTFLLEPTRTSAEKFGVVLGEASQLAAASGVGGPPPVSAGPGDNTNMLALIDLGSASTLVDGASYFDAYTNTASRVAVQTRRAESLADTEGSLLNSALGRRSNLNGVSLVEVAAKLIRFQQAYQAAAQVIAAARDVFDVLVRATQ